MTDRQERLLAISDGRYFAIDKVGTGLGLVMKGEYLGKRTAVHFGLPSGVALLLNLARRAYLEIKDTDVAASFVGVEQCTRSQESFGAFDYFEEYIAHVVFAFTALEAFANETIPRDFTYEAIAKRPSGQTYQTRH